MSHSGNRIDPILRTELIPSGWDKFMRYCIELQNGRIERLDIQNGIPVFAEVVTTKIKFS